MATNFPWQQDEHDKIEPTLRRIPNADNQIQPERNLKNEEESRDVSSNKEISRILYEIWE